MSDAPYHMLKLVRLDRLIETEEKNLNDAESNNAFRECYQQVSLLQNLRAERKEGIGAGSATSKAPSYTRSPAS